MEIGQHEAFREIDRGPIGKGWTDLTPEEIEARDGPRAIWRCATELQLVLVSDAVNSPSPCVQWLSSAFASTRHQTVRTRTRSLIM